MCLIISVTLHRGWYCSSNDESDIVGKAARTNMKNRKGLSWVFQLLFFPSVHQPGLCRKLPGMVCLHNILAFLGLIVASFVRSRWIYDKESRTIYCDFGHGS